ncbi:MAG: c-type cytochrome [Rhodanobacter sp.]|nr:MAG: c-type cytochrome [Rhodanobacter sp.]TAM09310.1 MAG: c-type cytochrome [Rhodanobacter sp.]TAM37255.1 MAG: c-type cytochrome [Rhodanobacter sp.]
MKARRAVAGAVVMAALAMGAWWWLRPLGHAPVARAASTVSAASLHDPALIARGTYLALTADCAGCHTAKGGTAYAGGRRLPTPFGNVAVPNLTPDAATGLGAWSFEDFWQALHTGIGRDRQPLYPAFPYTSYTRMTRDDALAIFAYLQSLPAVRQAAPSSELAFPYDQRRLLRLWRALYFRPGPAAPVAGDRGAYLVDAIGHCAECHAPRNRFGATRHRALLTGGEIPAQHWFAPDLAASPHGGLAGWRERDIVDLLKMGQAARGAAFGPMADVVRGSTQYLTAADLNAIAAHLVALPPRQVPGPGWQLFDARRLVAHGEEVYRKRCADCHGDDGRGVAGVYPPLAGNASVTEPSGINAIRIVLLGGFAPTTVTNHRPYSMPPYQQTLDDVDVASVVSYVRAMWGNRAGAVSPQDVARYRHTPVE